MNKARKRRILVDKILAVILIIWQIIYIAISFYGYFNNIKVPISELWWRRCVDELIILLLFGIVRIDSFVEEKQKDESNTK